MTIRQSNGPNSAGEVIPAKAVDWTNMLPVTNRLRREADFEQLAKSRNKAFSKALMVKVRENGLPHSRFGVVVGLKVHKRAVKRNLVKRRIREILRKNMEVLPKGLDVMVMATPSAIGTDFNELEAQLLSCFAKIGKTKR